MSRTAVLEYLVRQVLVPDVESGALPWVPGQTGIDELAERYEHVFDKSLALDDADWEVMLERLEQWWEEADPSRHAFLEEEALWQEMVSKCDTLPTYQQVAEKLGADSADVYLENVETLENRPGGPDIGVECEYARGTGDTRAPLPKRQLEEVVTIVALLAGPDRTDAIHQYRTLKEQRNADKRARRSRLRQQNAPFIERARSLGFWFPYPDHLDRWQRDVRTAPYYPLFHELLRRVRDKLRAEHGVMQYVPKRRLTGKTASELPRNLENMGRYLMQENG